MLMALGSDGRGKHVKCDADGNLYMIPAPLATNQTVTIANGASLSNSVDLGGRALSAILMPAAWTAAALTFQASLDGVTFFNLLDGAGAEITASAAAGSFIRLSINDWLALRYLKIRSGTAAIPVNQGADRILSLVAVAGS